MDRGTITAVASSQVASKPGKTSACHRHSNRFRISVNTNGGSRQKKIPASSFTPTHAAPTVSAASSSCITCCTRCAPVSDAR
jgi:hypothetical protein